MKSKSFTLIELLVVIVIIGILAGVIVISTSSSIDKANFAKAQAFSSTVKNELLSNLVSEWTFDNASNIGEDTWGNNNGTPIGNTSLESNDCVFGTCAKFDGSGDYIDLGSNSLNITNDITISAWVKPDYLVIDGDQGGVIIGAASWNWHRFFIKNNGIYYVVHDGTTTFFKGRNYNFELNKWYYINVTVSKSEEKAYWYVNGNQIGLPESKTIWPTNAYCKLQFIGSVTAGLAPFSGLMDDVRAYNTTLSSFQIKQNYIAGLNSLFAGGNISKKEYNERIDQLSIK